MSTRSVSDPRYPIGIFSRPEAVDAHQRHDSIATLAALPENLRAAVYRLDERQFDTPYRDDGCRNIDVLSRCISNLSITPTEIQ